METITRSYSQWFTHHIFSSVFAEQTVWFHFLPYFPPFRKKERERETILCFYHSRVSQVRQSLHGINRVGRNSGITLPDQANNDNMRSFYTSSSTAFIKKLKVKEMSEEKRSIWTSSLICFLSESHTRTIPDFKVNRQSSVVAIWFTKQSI